MALRVLQIIGQIAVGGAERQLLGLCRRIDQSRFPTAVCYYAPNPDNMVEEFRSTGVQLHFIDKFHMPLWRFFGQLRGCIRQFRPDVIHTWQLSPNWWGRLAGWTCGCRRFIASERTCRVTRSVLMRLLERFVGSRTIWLANSRAVASALAAAVGIPADRIRVVYNAVELPVRDRSADRAAIRRELALTTDQPIVLSVGRLTQAKNYPMLFRAAKRVLADRPDVRFIVAGHGEQEADLRVLHEQLDLGDRVQMLGLRHDVSRLMNAADVFCLCSQWEGFPNVLAEAMATGVSNVSTRFPGVEEFLIENQTGLLVDIDDDQKLASSLLRLLSDVELQRELGDAGQQWVQGHFSWSHLVADMECLYTDVVTSEGDR